MQLFIFGMHRSGTSALAGILEMMGFHVGEPGELIPPKPDNPRGFFERQEVSDSHHEVMAALDATWDAPLNLKLDSLSDPEVRGFSNRLRKHVEAMDRYPRWVLKDPLLCLLFPLWRDLVREPVAILIQRSPLEVAESLRKRNGLPLIAGVALWELYTLMALEQTRDLPRKLVHHRRLLEEPNTVVRELAEFLGEMDARVEIPSTEDVEAFIDPALFRAKEDVAHRTHFLNQNRSDLLEALERDDLGCLPWGRQALSQDSHEVLELLGDLHGARADLVAALCERDLAFEEKVQIFEESKAFARERDELFVIKNRFFDESVLHYKEKVRVTEEKVRVTEEKVRVMEEKTRVTEEKTRVMEEKIRVTEERDLLAREKDQLLAERDASDARVRDLLGSRLIRWIDRVRSYFRRKKGGLES